MTKTSKPWTCYDTCPSTVQTVIIGRWSVFYICHTVHINLYTASGNFTSNNISRVDFTNKKDHYMYLIPQFVVRNQIDTRKSSCVNARGIPTAAYQVLHLLSCTGEGGYPCRGVPHPCQGVSHPCQGVPNLGYPPIRPCWGVPHHGYPPPAGVPPWLDLAGVPP